MAAPSKASSWPRPCASAPCGYTMGIRQSPAKSREEHVKHPRRLASNCRMPGRRQLAETKTPPHRVFARDRLSKKR
uniref:Secreted protein n=1 Tax=Panagrellus redivivus TaxID=6233 RepID=A0A7E4ZVB6_PANRE